MDVSRVQFIPRARMPILKIWTRSRVCVDISISDDTGPRAARYMAQEARKFAPLRPLVLVLKAFLKSQVGSIRTPGTSHTSMLTGCCLRLVVKS